MSYFIRDLTQGTWVTHSDSGTDSLSRARAFASIVDAERWIGDRTGIVGCPQFHVMSLRRAIEYMKDKVFHPNGVGANLLTCRAAIRMFAEANEADSAASTKRQFELVIARLQEFLTYL